MTKRAILRRKIIRAYNNKKNWEYSEFKGYPKGSYFGYFSLDELIRSVSIKYYRYYGKGLKNWRFD